MVELDYDLVQFQRVLCNTATYQRESSRVEPADGEPYAFPGPLLRRMSAEQIWDSLLTLVVDDVDGDLAAPGEAAEPVYSEYEEMIELTDDELRGRVARELVRYTDPRRLPRDAARAAPRARRRSAARRARGGDPGDARPAPVRSAGRGGSAIATARPSCASSLRRRPPACGRPRG